MARSRRSTSRWNDVSMDAPMTEPFRTRLLEVEVVELGANRFEWRVWDSSAMVMLGYEAARETARIRGERGLFILLCTGVNSPRRE
jgi:hypothetical protein